MQNIKKINILLLGALVVAVVIGGVAYKSVQAATTVPTTSTSTITQANAGWGIGKGPMGGYSKEDLANALGISTDVLTSAYQTAYKAALDQAVSKGLITQAQEDELVNNGRAFPFGDRWKNWLVRNGIEFNTYLAQSLNITVDQLKAAYQKAYYTRIDQAVTDGKLTLEQADLLKGRYALFSDSTFQSSMQSAFKDAVTNAVTSGVITQSQADQILSKSENMFMGMGGWGGPAGGRRGGSGWNGKPLLTAP